MAEESDGRTTNIYGSDLMKMDQKPDPELETKKKEEETDIYNVMKGDLLVFPFGKPATSEGLCFFVFICSYHFFRVN